MTAYVTTRNKSPYGWQAVTYKKLRAGLRAEEYTGISVCLDEGRRTLKVLRDLAAKIDADDNFNPPWLFHVHDMRQEYNAKLSTFLRKLVARARAKNKRYRKRAVYVINWDDLMPSGV